MPTGTT